MINLHLESVIEVLDIRLQLHILFSESRQFNVLLRVLDLDDVEFALTTVKIRAHLLDLSLFKLFLLNLQYLGLQVDHSLLELIPLLRHLRYLDLLRLVLLPQGAHSVLDALLVVWVPRRSRIFRVKHRRSLVPASRPETEHFSMLVRCLIQAKFRFVRLYLSYFHVASGLTKPFGHVFRGHFLHLQCVHFK